MNTLDFTRPAKNAGLSAAPATPDLQRSSPKSAEPFDALMNRALTQPSRRYSERPEAAKEPASESGFHRAVKDKSGTAKKPKLAERAESPASETSASPVGAETSIREQKNSDALDSSADNVTDGAPAQAATTSPVEGGAMMTASLVPVVAAQADVQTPAAAKAFGGVNAVSTVAVANETPGTPISEPARSEFGNGPQRADSEIGVPSATPKASAEISTLTPEPAKKSEPASGAVPIDSLLDKPEIAQDSPAIAAIPTADKLRSQVSEPSGISAAQQAATMNDADKANKFAGPEQNLPGVTARERMPVAEKPLSVSAADATNTTYATHTTHAERASVSSPVDNLISVSAQTELRTRALDRTHDIVALHGMRLKDSNADSLNVVIKPGAGIQLSLQLIQSADGIQAQATLNKGDFNQLNQHWPELQQRLEERGIRLAPLGGESSAAANDNGNFQRQQHRPAENESLAPGAFAEFALAGAVASSSAARVAAPAVERGWEGWA